MYAEGDSNTPNHDCANYLMELLKEVCAKFKSEDGDVQMALLLFCFESEVSRFKYTKELTKRYKENGEGIEEQFDFET
jgi:hypothetical protein